MSNTTAARPTRRTIAAGAAWAVPVIAVGAPAPSFAASMNPCKPTTYFDGLKPGTRPSTVAFLPSNVIASLQYSSNISDQTPGDTGVVARTTSSSPWNYIELEMLRIRKNDWVELTITLTQAVQGLTFKIHDIDSRSGGYLDTVVIPTPGYTFARGGNIKGTGSSADPFAPIAVGDTPIESGLGDVVVTWPGLVQTVKVRYVAGVTGDSQNQHVGIGDLSYDACVDQQSKQLVIDDHRASVNGSTGRLSTSSGPDN